MRAYAGLSLVFLFTAACGSTPAPAPAPKVAATASRPATNEKGVKTPKRPIVDVYYGVPVADDYRWLENPDDPNVRAWTDAQNVATRSYLDGFADRKAIGEQISSLMSAKSPDYLFLEYRAGQIFAIKDAPPKQQPSLVVMKGDMKSPAAEKTLVDPNELDPSGATTIDFYVPSQDGTLVAVSMSKGGTESGTVHVYEVATGKKRPDVIPRVNGGTAGGSLAWAAGNAGFYYTRYPREGERPPVDVDFYQQVYFHKLGTPEASDRYELGKDFPRIAETDLHASPDGKVVHATVANGDGGEFAHYLLGAGLGLGGWVKLADYADNVIDSHFGPDGRLYLLSRKGAPRGKILRLAKGVTDLAKAEVVVPEGEPVIRQFAVTRTRLYTADMVGGPSQLRSFSNVRSQEPAKTLPIPEVSAIQQLEALEGDDVLFRSQSYTAPPAWFRYEAATAKSVKTPLAVQSPTHFDDAEVKRDTCTSRDGTRVPITLLTRKGTPLDGSAPALLSGYGGFDISSAPKFNPLRRLWLDAGGVFAVANIRGGGEFGQAWHDAGRLLQKQNVFDDFIACGRFLVERKYTRPERLAITGRSNGGLLMGAVLTQAPDLFRAVVTHVGIYDMLRLELTPNGAFNVTEYGSVKDRDQFRALFAYSPLHNVKDNTEYPAVLLLTGANDPRVEPYNSRKMAARLQAATSSARPILLRTSIDTGHGMGTPLSKAIEEETDVHAFLFRELAMHVDRETR